METSAGEMIDDDTGDTNVKHEMIKHAAHFLRIDQFFGFPGSFSPLHVTCLY